MEAICSLGGYNLGSPLREKLLALSLSNSSGKVELIPMNSAQVMETCVGPGAATYSVNAFYRRIEYKMG